jgi:hypothetical protein
MSCLRCVRALLEQTQLHMSPSRTAQSHKIDNRYEFIPCKSEIAQRNTHGRVVDGESSGGKDHDDAEADL